MVISGVVYLDHPPTCLLRSSLRWVSLFCCPPRSDLVLVHSLPTSSLSESSSFNIVVRSSSAGLPVHRSAKGTVMMQPHVPNHKWTWSQTWSRRWSCITSQSWSQNNNWLPLMRCKKCNIDKKKLKKKTTTGGIRMMCHGTSEPDTAPDNNNNNKSMMMMEKTGWSRLARMLDGMANKILIMAICAFLVAGHTIPVSAVYSVELNGMDNARSSSPITYSIAEDKVATSKTELSASSPDASSFDAQQGKQMLIELYDSINKFYLDSSKIDPSTNSSWPSRDRFLTSLDAHPVTSSSQTVSRAKSLVKLLHDRYSRYVPKEEFAKFGKYDVTGTGLLLMLDEDKTLYVASPPVKGSAGEQAGVQAGDRILNIAGKEVKGVSPFEAAQLMVGEKNQELVLGIRKKDQADVTQVVLNRQFVEREPVKFRLEMINNKKWAYIELKEFTSESNTKVRQAIQELQPQNPDVYVLDLRDNLGGVFEGALEIAGLFLPTDLTAVHVFDRNGGGGELPIRVRYSGPVDESGRLVDRSNNATGTSTFVSSPPLILLTNGLSASSSEVLAGALQDHCRAVVVGSRSYGKGLVQAVLGLQDGSGVVLTVARYQTPKHHEIQEKGIEPDVKVSFPPAWIGNGLDKIDLQKVQEKLSMCEAV